MKARALLPVFCLLAFLWLLTVPAYGKTENNQPEEMRTLLEMQGSQEARRSERANNSRNKVLGNAAQTIAFQRGFTYRYSKIMGAVVSRSHELDSIFSFGPLLIDKRVLPPVIRWTNQAVNIESDVYATTVEAQYRIVAPARIVSTPPTWRDYIEMETGTMQATPAILPQTSDEKSLWRIFVEKGWNEGMAHADDVFDLNMNRLISDYRGVLRFKMLADQGLVSVPILAEGHLGIQVGNHVLNMDQKTFRITMPAVFQAQEEKRK